MDLYAEELISNYEHPHNKGKLADANAEFGADNPVCGDHISISLKIEGSTVKDVKFDGDGCAISIASASMLTESIKGKDLSEIEKMGFAELKAIIKVDPGPARLKCATLPLKALKLAVFAYEHKSVDDATKRL